MLLFDEKEIFKKYWLCVFDGYILNFVICKFIKLKFFFDYERLILRYKCYVISNVKVKEEEDEEIDEDFRIIGEIVLMLILFVVYFLCIFGRC